MEQFFKIFLNTIRELMLFARCNHFYERINHMFVCLAVTLMKAKVY